MEMAQTDKHLELAEQHTVGGTVLRGLFNDDIPPEVLMLEAEDFSSQPLGTMWMAIRPLLERGVPPDLVAVHEELKTWEGGCPPGVIGHLANLANEVPTAANLAYWASMVLRSSRYRGAKRSVGGALHKSNHGGSADMLAADVLDAVSQLPTDGATELEPMKVAMAGAFKQLEQRHQNRGQPFGLQWGFPDLDSIVTGMHPGDLVVLAARPSMGKTAMALQLALQGVGAEGVTIVLSAEMSKESLAQRMWAVDARVSMHAIRTANLSQTDMRKVTESTERISRANIEITDRMTSMKDIRAALRRYASRKVKMVVVDYLQLLCTDGRSREEEVSKISRELKAIAKDLRCPVIALSQLNRSVESRTDKRPLLSDLRESGAIEQDADTVVMLYRDDYYNAESEKPGIAEALVRKQRNGSVGTADLRWVPELTRFDSLYRGPA